MKRVLMIMGIFAMITGVASADTSVSWTSPADGTTYTTQTSVSPEGTASTSGATGGTGLDLAIVIDVSGSMGTYYSDKTRLEYAQEAAIALVDSLPEDTTSVTVIAFNSYSNTYCTLTALNSNKTDVVNAINGLSASGGTIIGSGISAATTELTSSNHTDGRSTMMVVLSDGSTSYYNYGTYSALAAAEAAADAGITVHTVGVPGHSSTQMAGIASAGGGIYTSVDDLDDLEDLFDGTGGNLVGIDHVDIQLPDGTWISDIATDALGNFTVPSYLLSYGTNTFTAIAYGSDGTSATTTLTLNVTPVPVPGAVLLGMLGMGTANFMRRRRNA